MFKSHSEQTYTLDEVLEKALRVEKVPHPVAGPMLIGLLVALLGGCVIYAGRTGPGPGLFLLGVFFLLIGGTCILHGLANIDESPVRMSSSFRAKLVHGTLKATVKYNQWTRRIDLVITEGGGGYWAGALIIPVFERVPNFRVQLFRERNGVREYTPEYPREYPHHLDMHQMGISGWVLYTPGCPREALDYSYSVSYASADALVAELQGREPYTGQRFNRRR